jgi:hypothetical protein
MCLSVVSCFAITYIGLKQCVLPTGDSNHCVNGCETRNSNGVSVILTYEATMFLRVII